MITDAKNHLHYYRKCICVTCDQARCHLTHENLLLFSRTHPSLVHSLASSNVSSFVRVCFA